MKDHHFVIVLSCTGALVVIPHCLDEVSLLRSSAAEAHLMFTAKKLCFIQTRGTAENLIRRDSNPKLNILYSLMSFKHIYLRFCLHLNS